MRSCFLLLIIFLLAGLVQVRGQNSTASDSAPFTNGIDHVYVFAEKTKVESLFKLFRDDFQIPQVWAFRDYGGYASGGVSLSNVVLEFATFEDAANTSRHTEFQGIV